MEVGTVKKPDRFARAVGQHRHIACDGMGYILLEDTARHLLVMEHRAVVRLVKGMLKKHEGVMLTMAGAAYDAALKQLLAALAARSK